MNLHNPHIEAEEPNGGPAHVETPEPRPLIIERGHLQTGPQRWGYRSLTVICWLLWLYLFMPLLSVIAWVAGLTLVYEVLLQDLLLADLWRLLARYGSGIGVLTSVYLLWAITSYLRFRGVERRKAVEQVSDLQLAESHQLQMAELKTLKQADRLVLDPDQLERMFGAEQ